MKRILIGTVAMIMAMPCFAEDTPATGDKRITSKPYVDNAIATRQDKIPAANLSNTNYGETVMTYTPNGDGEIGERALFTGGEYDASTDADKLITASALNTAFTTLPETQTTKLVCANQSDGCTLWTITDQTAYGISGNGTTTIDLMSLIGNVAGEDYGYISNDGRDFNSTSTYGLTQDGTWVVDYGNGKRIRGKSQCSTRGVATIWYNNNNTFESDHFTTTLSDASGQYCYCQLDGYTTNGDNWGNMTALSAPWVFLYDYLGVYGYEFGCDDKCAISCAGSLFSDNANALVFRAAMFNSVQ